MRFSHCRSQKATRDKIDKVLKFVNWDTRLPTMTHYERACGSCSSRVEAVHNVYAALVEGCVFPGSSSTLPSKSRFGSMQVAMSEQALGMLISNVSCRTFAAAAPQMDGIGAKRHSDQEQNEGQYHDQEAAEEGDRMYNRRKLFRARMVLDSRRHLVRIAVSIFTMHRLEWLWVRVRHADGDGCLLDLACGRGPVVAAERDLQGLLMDHRSEGVQSH